MFSRRFVADKSDRCFPGGPSGVYMKLCLEIVFYMLVLLSDGKSSASSDVPDYILLKHFSSEFAAGMPIREFFPTVAKFEGWKVWNFLAE